MQNFTMQVGNYNYLRASSCYVRMKVFILEKGLSLEDEFDCNDQENTIYSVIFYGNEPISTARLLPIDENLVRITRVATLKRYRGKQLGSVVINSLEDISKKRQFKKILIHSEMTAVNFYEKLGYERSGSIYKEDGVDCINLVKKIEYS